MHLCDVSIVIACTVLYKYFLFIHTHTYTVAPRGPEPGEAQAVPRATGRGRH